MTLHAYRVIYGKKSTPEQEREYSCPELGTGTVGTQKDWQEFAKSHGYKAVQFIER